MAPDPTRPSIPPFQALAELELLQLILQDSTVTYPWNPAEAEAEVYFAELEQEVTKVGWSADELMEQGQVLASRLEQVWATVPAAPQNQLVGLFQKLQVQMPQQLVEQIVSRAQRVVSSNLTLADQLVQCVVEVLPEWGEEDLRVFARPLAMAMRGAETEKTLEAALRAVRCAAWTELSGVEQARLSLAIARYALAQQTTDTL